MEKFLVRGGCVSLLVMTYELGVFHHIGLIMHIGAIELL